MAIKETEVWVKHSGKTAKYYEDKGYNFPTYFNKKMNGFFVKKGTEILVKVEDLPDSSNVLVIKICDICGCETPKPQFYYNIIRRRDATDGLDRCNNCGAKYLGKQKALAKESNCIATVDPEFAKLLWNVEETYKFTCQSNQKVDFKCPQCGNKVENKIITNVYRNQKVPCYCNDNVPYPEKFMYSLLSQLNVTFETQKIFEWSKTNLNGTKRYDFYLNELNTIVETHGIQHYERSRRGARTFDEEQENDRIKELLAKENGINHYIIMDCKFSEMEYIKTNIIKSEFNHLFDLSKIDWAQCHDFACSSLVIKACNLWNEGYSDAKKIGDVLNLSKTTVTKYLKQGKKLGLCDDYDYAEVRSRCRLETAIRNGEIRNKPIIQLSLTGEIIDQWESATKAGEKLGIQQTSISLACRRKLNTAGGFIWMFKENYCPIEAVEKAKSIKHIERKVPIVRLSRDGEFIDEWESYMEASKKLGINNYTISLVCKGKRKTAGGFVWMLKKDYEKQYPS